jgi:predicted dehydrogenase
MWVRFLPAAVKLRELLTTHAIGEPRNVEASFRIHLPFEPTGRIFDPALGGGSLLDVGIYPISFSSMVFGMQPQEIISRVQMASTGVDASFQAQFDYSDGRRAQLAAGVDREQPNEIIIQGETGEVRLQQGWKLQHIALRTQIRSESFDLPPLGGGYSYQADEVARCLDGGLLESSVMPLDESLAILQTLDRIRKQWNLVFPGE